MLAKKLDEYVARLQLKYLKVPLTGLPPEQAAYIDVPKEVSCKTDHYRKCSALNKPCVNR